MIIDTSALLAILYQEEVAAYFAEAIAAATACRMSAANFLEAAINFDVHGDAEASRQLDAFIRRAGIEISALTFEQAQIARQAYLDFGKGRHSAGLNFGDCLAYALVRETSEPLLYKRSNFGRTDIPIYEPQS